MLQCSDRQLQRFDLGIDGLPLVFSRICLHHRTKTKLSHGSLWRFFSLASLKRQRIAFLGNLSMQFWLFNLWTMLLQRWLTLMAQIKAQRSLGSCLKIWILWLKVLLTLGSTNCILDQSKREAARPILAHTAMILLFIFFADQRKQCYIEVEMTLPPAKSRSGPGLRSTDMSICCYFKSYLILDGYRDKGQKLLVFIRRSSDNLGYRSVRATWTTICLQKTIMATSWHWQPQHDQVDM